MLLACVILIALGYAAHRISTHLHYKWDWKSVPQYLLRFDEESGGWLPNVLLLGLYNTIRLSLWGTVFATLIGTIMGLIHALGALERPEDMGRLIASAFVATLYGVSIANLIFLPIANKLKANSEEELSAYRLGVEGILALQAGESPRVAAARMRCFLSPRVKQIVDSAKR